SRTTSRIVRMGKGDGLRAEFVIGPKPRPMTGRIRPIDKPRPFRDPLLTRRELWIVLKTIAFEAMRSGQDEVICDKGSRATKRVPIEAIREEWFSVEIFCIGSEIGLDTNYRKHDVVSLTRWRPIEYFGHNGFLRSILQRFQRRQFGQGDILIEIG